MRYESTAPVAVPAPKLREFRSLLAKYAKDQYDRNSLNYYHSDVTSTAPIRALLSCTRRGDDPETVEYEREDAQAAAVDAIQHALHSLRLTITPDSEIVTEIAY